MTVLADFLEAEIAGSPRLSKRRRDDIARRRLLAHGTETERQAILAGLAERRMAPEKDAFWLRKLWGNRLRKSAYSVNRSPWARAPEGSP